MTAREEGATVGRAVNRSSGATPAEQSLGKLCEGTFLSLWSYPRLYRDQRSEGRTEGKEVADLIVVFENDIVIFSDKRCAVPSSDDVKRDWSRWLRRAVTKSAEQAWGAERWIRHFPTRLFLDRQCTQPFPLPLPQMSTARFHLIVVAHEIAQRCARALGGSGSLMIKSPLKGLSNHTEPFSIGDLDPSRSFVHVFDDTSLNIVMRTLDTIADFTAYLSKKETLLRSDQVIVAAGEEELLAFFLTRMNPDGQRDFAFPSDFTGVVLTEGNWEGFQAHPQRLAQIQANKISYSWDRLIETFNKHALQGTQYHGAPGGVQGTERIVRFMAREPRTRRRMLAEGINELLSRTPPRQRAARVVAPSRPGDPFYVFLLLPLQREFSYDENRTARANLLQMYCRVVKIRFPEAEDILGIATESGLDRTSRSEDAVYLDARMWTVDDESEARSIQAEFGLLTKTREWGSVVQEYPSAERPALGAHVRVGRNPRNKQCPCGSGLKYKKCHGRATPGP